MSEFKDFVGVRFTLIKTKSYPEMHMGMRWRDCAAWESKMHAFLGNTGARLYNVFHHKDGQMEVDWLCLRSQADKVKSYVPDKEREHVCLTSVKEIELDKLNYSPILTRQLVALI